MAVYYEFCEEFEARMVGDVLCLMNVKTFHLVEANPVGNEILKLIHQSVPADQIPARLTELFSVSLEQAAKDAELFLAKLEASEVVRKTRKSAAATPSGSAASPNKESLS